MLGSKLDYATSVLQLQSFFLIYIKLNTINSLAIIANMMLIAPHLYEANPFSASQEGMILS